MTHSEPKFIYPTKDIDVSPNPPEEFLATVRKLALDRHAFLNWAKDQPTLWINHPDTRKSIRESQQAYGLSPNFVH